MHTQHDLKTSSKEITWETYAQIKGQHYASSLKDWL
jgi:hypothetical protein